MFGNSVLRGIFGSKRNEVTREWRKLRKEKFMISVPHPIIFGRSIREETGGACNMYGGKER